MKTKQGKIARLPKEIREQLNRYLENGWRGARLVKARGQFTIIRLKVNQSDED
jgi:hypothetical protein